MDKLAGEVNAEMVKVMSGLSQEVTNRTIANNVQIDRNYQLKKDAQQSLAKNISRISPASALTFGSMTLARTGVDEYDRYIAATRNYRPIYNGWRINNPDFTDPKTGAARPLDESIFQTIPQLPFAPETLAELLMRTLFDFALMALMTIIFLTGAYFAFLRYDVR
jgi:hypothetical protein